MGAVTTALALVRVGVVLNTAVNLVLRVIAVLRVTLNSSGSINVRQIKPWQDEIETRLHLSDAAVNIPSQIHHFLFHFLYALLKNGPLPPLPLLPPPPLSFIPRYQNLKINLHTRYA